MTTEKAKYVRHPGQVGNARLPDTKEEQLEAFAQRIADDLRAYWNLHKMPLPWNQTKCKQRALYCPLATNEEVREYFTITHADTTISPRNTVLYMPRGCVETNEARMRLGYEYEVKQDQFKQLKKQYGTK